MNTTILANKNLLSKKQIKQEKSTIYQKIMNSPRRTPTTTFTPTANMLDSTDYMLKAAVSTLSPYAEIMNDMENFNSKISSSQPLFGHEDHLNEQTRPFSSNDSTTSTSTTSSSSSTILPQHSNFIHGISTPTLSNATSTTSLPFHHQEMMDFPSPSPSDSCTSTQHGGNATLSLTASKVSSVSNDGVRLGKRSREDSKKTNTPTTNTSLNTIHGSPMAMDHDEKKIEKLNSSFSPQITESSKTETNPLPTTNPLLPCFPLNHDVVTSEEMLENYINEINSPYFNSLGLPSNFQRMNPSSLLTSNPLLNNIIGKVS